MKCTVYWADEGLIFVPDCMLASREAERRYGPLLFCATFETEGLASDLAELVEREMDQRSFALIGVDLALRLGYEPKNMLPLPHGFRWQEEDWWQTHEELALLCGRLPPVAVASLRPISHRGGWEVVTNAHKAWPFRGIRVSQSRGAAMHFVAMWANAHASTLRGEIVTGFHSHEARFASPARRGVLWQAGGPPPQGDGLESA